MKTIIYQVKKKANKNGEAPIYARLTKDGKRTEKSTGIYIKVCNDWKQLLTAHQRAICNKTIEELKSGLLIRPLKVARFKTVINQFFEFKTNDLCYNTAKTYNTRLKNLLNFLKTLQTDLLITEFKKVHLMNYKIWFQNKVSKHPEYWRRNALFVKQVFDFAIEHEMAEVNPVLGMKFERKKVQRVEFLTETELEQLKTVDLPQKLKQTQQMFLFMCETGMAFCDMQKFDPGLQVVELPFLHLKGNRTKTEAEFVIPVSEAAKELIDQFPAGFKKITNQAFNRNLKLIGKLAGIKQPIKSHMARKSFAMNWLDKGLTIETLSHILGHSEIGTTQQHYARVQLNRICNEINLLNQLKSAV